MFNYMNLILITMLLVSCVPVADTNKSKLKFLSKEAKEAIQAEKIAKKKADANMPGPDKDSSVVKMNSAELKVAVRKILDANCLSCHGDGKSFQSIANLAPSIEMIEKDSSLVSPLGYSNSNLYQQITNGSMKVYLKNPNDAYIIKDWIISLTAPAENVPVVLPVETPSAGDTQAPLITKFSPDGTNFEMGTTSVKLDIITDESSICRYSLSDANLDYNQMTKFSATGDKSHSHTLSKLKAGKYSYSIKCMDVAKNVSLSKEIGFSIQDVVVVGMVTQQELRASVKKIIDSSCLVCHGAGKKYQVIADLSLSIENMEKNIKLVIPKDLAKSKLYQAVTTGGMNVYLDKPADANVIKEWILSIPAAVEPVPVVVDTKSPLITSFLPNGTIYEDIITSVKLSAVTDEAASCAFTTNASVVDYNSMTKFAMTGEKSHAHTVINLKAGNHSYFVKCMDTAKNVSLSKEIKFNIKVAMIADTKAPLITSFLPNGTTYESLISSVKLDVVTDEASSCAFTTSAAVVDYNAMTKFAVTGDKAHSHTASNLKAGSHSYFVKCMDTAKNVSVSKEIKFIIKEVVIPVVVDIKAPIIKSFLPNGTTYEGIITSVKLEAVTDEAASCAFTTSAAVIDYNAMTKFATTGDKAHTHTAINLKSGSHSYFIKCIDPSKNVSVSKEIKFVIKEVQVIKLTTNELRVAVKKIFDVNCMVCHGAGKGFQAIANLAPSIEVIEKDITLVSPNDLAKSFLYKQVTVGSMKIYLPDPKDADIIKEWILSIPKGVATPPPDEIPMPVNVDQDSTMKDYNSEVQMGSRSYMESVLLQVFDAQGSPAANYIQTDILQKIEFGGSCDLYSSGDKGNTTVQFPREQCLNGIGIVMPPTNNSMRYSLTAKVCEKLVADKDRLGAVRKKIYENQIWGTPTDDKLLIAWRLFHQSTDIDANGLSALKELKNVTTNNDDTWKLIILTLCISPEWQAI